MLKLYYSPKTRSLRPRFMLEELGVPYDLVQVDLRGGEQKTEAFKKIHPHGKVPVLQDGDLTVIESMAIVGYLADKFAEKKMAPPLASPLRGTYWQWMVYGAVNVDAALITGSKPAFEACAEVLEPALAGKDYLLGAEFSAADCAMGSLLAWAKAIGFLDAARFPNCLAYTKRITARPAFRRATAD